MQGVRGAAIPTAHLRECSQARLGCHYRPHSWGGRGMPLLRGLAPPSAQRGSPPHAKFREAEGLAQGYIAKKADQEALGPPGAVSEPELWRHAWEPPFNGAMASVGLLL